MNSNPSIQPSTNPTALTEEQVQEFQSILTEMKGGWGRLKDLPEHFASFRTENETVRKDLADVRRHLATRAAVGSGSRVRGSVSDACARHLTGIAIAARLRSGKQIDNADRLHGLAKEILGI